MTSDLSPDEMIQELRAVLSKAESFILRQAKTISELEARLDGTDKPVSPNAAVQKIIKEVTKAYRVTLADVSNYGRRDRRTIEARWEIWYRVHKEAKWTLNRIGRQFNRNHTTIMYGIKQHELKLVQL